MSLFTLNVWRLMTHCGVYPFITHIHYLAPPPWWLNQFQESLSVSQSETGSFLSFVQNKGRRTQLATNQVLTSMTKIHRQSVLRSCHPRKIKQVHVAVKWELNHLDLKSPLWGALIVCKSLTIEMIRGIPVVFWHLEHIYLFNMNYFYVYCIIRTYTFFFISFEVPSFFEVFSSMNTSGLRVTRTFLLPLFFQP